VKKDSMRPLTHYAPAANWLSDPNGLVHHRGEWHLFYQYNPFAEDWGHMSWGHAVSPDLAHWQELDPALLEADGTMIYSGSAVIDHSNSAGFGKDAMVAIYTGAIHEPEHQFQCLAASIDNGRHWTKFDGNPVIDRGLADFRDPNVFWHAPSGRWIMVVVLSAENRALIYGSADLKQWQELSEIPTSGTPGHLWECPLLIELPVEGADECRWLFKVDVFSGVPGSGAIYLTGRFDGTRFTADGPWQLADHGSDFYAAIAWHEPRDVQGRPCWIGWMGNHAHQKHLPPQGWRGAMSLPRRMALRRDGAAWRMVQEIEPAVAALFGALTPLSLDLDARPVPSAARITIPGGTDPWMIEIAGEAGRLLLLSRDGGSLRVQRKDPVTPALDVAREVALGADGAIDLWLDTGSIELVGDRGAMSLTLQHRLGGAQVALRCDRNMAVAMAGLVQASA
jgi:sucrose-6-phosphate hydrolase SacC (GH32 family)